MAVLDTPITTYSDTTPQKRAITDVLALIDPGDAPLIDRLGGLDGGAAKMRLLNWPGSALEWIEDTREPLTSALTTASITSTVTTITVADASLFQEGMIILIDAEQMWISGAVLSTEVLTVTRNYSGTQASHASDAAIEIVGMARLEGAESDDLAFTDRTAGINYTEIFHREIKVTRTQNQIEQYGIAEEFDYQANKAVPHLMRLIEKQVYIGAKKAGSATTPRAFGGLSTFITDNLINAGGAIVQADFEDALEAAYGDGGEPTLAAVNPANMQVIKNFYDSSNFLRVDRSETTAGMVINQVLTPFGTVDLLMDRWARADRVNILTPANVGLLTLQPFLQEPLAKTGDYERGQVIWEGSLAVRMDKSHAAVTAIS